MRKKQKKRITILFISFLVISVGLGILIIPNLGTHSSTDAAIEINDKYSLNRTSAHSFNLTDIEELTFIIKPEVQKFNHDENFIIATGSNMFKDNSYWIIDMGDNKIYGPVDEEEFTAKKNELSIELNLIEVSDFFK